MWFCLQLLFQNLLILTASLDTLSGVVIYTHEWGANSSQPIHTQAFLRNVYASSSESSPSTGRVRAEVSDRVQISLTPRGSRQGDTFHTG